MLKIKYVGFNENTGYGVAARNLITALRAFNIQVSFTKILPGKIIKGGIIQNEESNTGIFDAVIVHTVPEYYPYWLKKEKQKNPNAKVLGYTAWETDKLPLAWPALLNLMDGILVPSNWNKIVFMDNDVHVPIYVLPHVSEFKGEPAFKWPLNKELEQLLQKVSNKFLFYYIGVWNERKAPWRLIKTFKDEFQAEEDVALIVKTDERDWTTIKRAFPNILRKRFGNSSDAFNKLKVRKDNIFLINSHLSNSDIAHLHQAGNCFASFSRGEGWGMGAFEAAWFGNPVMITGHGGHLDFLTEPYSFLLDYDFITVKTTFGKESYTSSQQWAEVNVNQAKKVMRYIFENQQIVKQKGLDLRNFVKENYNHIKVAKRLIEILRYG